MYFCWETAEGLKARSDTPHQNIWGLPKGFPLGRRPTQSQWGSATPSRWLPLATDSKGSNLAAAAAVLASFRIGPSRNYQQKFTISYSNHGPNLLSWRYKQFAKLEFVWIFKGRIELLFSLVVTQYFAFFYLSSFPLIFSWIQFFWLQYGHLKYFPFFPLFRLNISWKKVIENLLLQDGQI